MSEISNHEYWKEINELAEQIVSEAMEQCDNDRDAAQDAIFDTILHQTVDGHQWVIYYSYNLDVIRHSDNESYYADNFGGESLAASLEQGLDTLHCHIAFWCMYADIADLISDKLDDFEENQA